MDTSALPADLSQYIQDEVATGAFASSNELLAAAVREHKERKQKLQKLKADIDEGFAALERGEYIEIRSIEEHEALLTQILDEVRIENGASENGK
jgi:putative addiction module CopG family antidote